MTVGLLAVGAAAAAGCGGSTTYANRPSPPSPINLTVSINDSRVSVSPTSVGAGPVVFIVTNRASHAESLSVTPAGSGAGQPLANTGPIGPEGTARVSVDFTPGDYTVSTSSGATADALLAAPSPAIQPATVVAGSPRPSSSSNLMLP